MNNSQEIINNLAIQIANLSVENASLKAQIKTFKENNQQSESTKK